MKKILSIISTIIIIAALLGMTIPAFASSPNTGWLNINSSYSATGYVQMYGFDWDTEFTYKKDSIIFTTPRQEKSAPYDNYLKQTLSAKGWIFGEDMFIEYHSWNTVSEGGINCEVFGKLKKE